MIYEKAKGRQLYIGRIGEKRRMIECVFVSTSRNRHRGTERGKSRNGAEGMTGIVIQKKEDRKKKHSYEF